MYGQCGLSGRVRAALWAAAAATALAPAARAEPGERRARLVAEVEAGRAQIAEAMAPAALSGKWSAVTDAVDRVRRALLAMEAPAGADAKDFDLDRRRTDVKAYDIRRQAEKRDAAAATLAMAEFEAAWRGMKGKWFAEAGGREIADRDMKDALLQMRDLRAALDAGEWQRLHDDAERLGRLIRQVRTPAGADEAAFLADRRDVEAALRTLGREARQRDREDAREAWQDSSAALARLADRWFLDKRPDVPPPPPVWTPGDDAGRELRDIWRISRGLQRRLEADEWDALRADADRLREAFAALAAPAGADPAAFGKDRRRMEWRTRGLSRQAAEKDRDGARLTVRQWDSDLNTFMEAHYGRRPGWFGERVEGFEPPAGFRAGLPRRFALWRDEAGTWRLRATSRGDVRFAGTVTLVGGRFTEVAGVRIPADGRGVLRENFQIAPGRGELTFDLAAHADVEGITFRTDDAAETIRFDLLIDGKRRAEDVFLGADGRNPREIPFRVRAK